MGASTKSPEFTGSALKVMEARYLRINRLRSIVETPVELFKRVARAVAQAELLLGNAKEAARYEEVFLDTLLSLDFLPNSPTIMTTPPNAILGSARSE